MDEKLALGINVGVFFYLVRRGVVGLVQAMNVEIVTRRRILGKMNSDHQKKLEFLVH